MTTLSQHVPFSVALGVGLTAGYFLGSYLESQSKRDVGSTSSVSSLSGCSTTQPDQEHLVEKIKKIGIRAGKPNPVFAQLAKKQTLADLPNLKGKRVLVRVDYNVPVKGGVVTEGARIVATLPLLNEIRKQEPKCIVLISHFGQPGIGFNKSEFTLAPAAKYLQDLEPQNKVVFLEDCVGPEIEEKVNAGKDGVIFVCENLRFHIEETGSIEGPEKKKIKAKPDEIERFRKQLQNLGDVFIFEAFGAAHRPHSSISGISMPQRVCGLLVQRELKFFSEVLSAPRRPFVAVLGGSKISDKILVIQNLLQVCDHLIIGGGMCYTFKKAAGIKIGKSLFDAPGAANVESILKEAKELGVQVHLPEDYIISESFDGNNVGVTNDEAGIPDDWLGLDIGPKSRAKFSKTLESANTILWNGPMGVFEKPQFAAGTLSVLVDLVLATRRGATTIIGGGDSGAAAEHFYFQDKKCAEQVTHVSTGGGASLVLMEGKELPGVSWLTENN